MIQSETATSPNWSPDRGCVPDVVNNCIRYEVLDTLPSSKTTPGKCKQHYSYTGEQYHLENTSNEIQHWDYMEQHYYLPTCIIMQTKHSSTCRECFQQSDVYINIQILYLPNFSRADIVRNPFSDNLNVIL